MPGEKSRRAGWALPPMASFIGAALALVGITFASGAPSPLFVVYQQEWHFPAWILTVAFAIYAITLITTLLFAGSFSDYLGRRPILIGALLTEIVSMLLFVFASDISWIILARAVQGIATGAATSTFTAAIVELAPERHKKFGALIGSTAPIGGLALGAIVTGMAIQFSQAPSLLIFGFLAAMFVLSIAVLVFSIETVERRPGALASLKPRLSVPVQARREFIGSSFVLTATWMLAGLFFGLGPSILRGIFHIEDGLINGFLVAVPPTAGTVTSLLSSRLTPRRAILLGTVVALVGAAITTVSVLVGWFPLLVLGAIGSGAGFGASFSGILRTLGPLAVPSRRAELFAGIYLVNYLALGAPALAAGILIGFFGLLATVTGYGILVVLAAAVSLGVQLRLARS
ncbi:MAG: MFS transporter [Chloroflexi bacterium 54-19]|nr:MAG: MFS transporter [Chloroflexi bacterium 54-19]